MNIRTISISDYTYTLPEEKIAMRPLRERDASRLLLYRNGTITEDVYRNLDLYLPSGSLLVANNTKVVAARLLFKKESGGTIEIFCLEPGNAFADVSSAMGQQGQLQWKCLIGGASKWKPGQLLHKEVDRPEGPMLLTATYLGKEKDYFVIDLQWTPSHLSFAEVLELAGVIPLPPYIKRSADPSDTDRYQTTYAAQAGSVAAPTAGLHFTPAVFEKLQQKNIQQSFVTLHVGAGTFKPVKAQVINDHDMHAEFLEVPMETINNLIAFTGKIYAVGTTSARTLESIYWMGVKIFLNPAITQAELFISQWEVYDHLQQHAVEPVLALQQLKTWMEKNVLKRLLSNTQLLIAPGYRCRIIRGLITNFHQPQSTLLLLVAALAGERWKNIYSYALDNNFRFLSYGDGCLIEIPVEEKSAGSFMDET